MRFKTIEDVKQYVEKELWMFTLIRLHDEPLKAELHKSSLSPENIASYSQFERYKKYTLLLCYIEAPVGNIIRQWDQYKEAKPDFALLREYCRTYYLYDESSTKFQYLRSELPATVLVEQGFDALNSFLLKFLRPGIEDPEKLSLIPDAQHLYKDVQIVTSVNKALVRCLDQGQICRQASNQLLSSDTKLFVTETAKHASDVYEIGPRSCMKRVLHNVDEVPMNPAAVYSTEDVAVIYGKRGGSITGRAVLNKNTSHYVRAYGDQYFIEALHANGYVQDNDAIRGCKIARISVDNNPDVVLLPYLDGNCQYLIRKGDHFKISSRGDILAEHTSGVYNLATDEPVTYGLCDNCGDYEQEQGCEVRFNGEWQMWCQNCVDHGTEEVMTGRHSSELWYIEDVEHIMPDGQAVNNEVTAEELGWVKDINDDWQDQNDVYKYDGNYYLEEDLEYHHLRLNAKGEVVEDDEDDEDDEEAVA